MYQFTDNGTAFNITAQFDLIVTAVFSFDKAHTGFTVRNGRAVIHGGGQKIVVPVELMDPPQADDDAAQAYLLNLLKTS